MARARVLYSVASLSLAVPAWQHRSMISDGTLQRTNAMRAESVTRASGTAFVNVSVIPMDRERILTDQTVLVQDGRIRAIGPVGKVRIPPGTTRIDARGKFLIPGLADMHMHLQAFDSVTAEHVLFMFLANGVTTIRNMDYLHGPLFLGAWEMEKLDGPTLLHFRARLASGALTGPRMYTSGPWRAPLKSTSIMALLTTPDPATQGEVDQLIASYKAAGFDFVKVHDEDSLRYAYVVNAARAAGIPVAGHVPAGIPLATALAAHQRSIEHLTGYSEIVRSSSDIPTLVSATKQAGVWNCPTMLMESYNAHAITRDSMAQWPEARFFSTAGIRVRDSLRHYDAEHPVNATASLRTLALQRQLVKALQDSGARLLSGTDSPAGATVPGFSLHHELQALVLAGLTPYQALATSTRNVAMYFGTLAATGTVDVGKRADLLLLDANPLQDIRNTTRQSGVMIDGRWYSRDELDRTLAAVEGTLSYDWGYVH